MLAPWQIILYLCHTEIDPDSRPDLDPSLEDDDSHLKGAHYTPLLIRKMEAAKSSSSEYIKLNIQQAKDKKSEITVAYYY